MATIPIRDLPSYMRRLGAAFPAAIRAGLTGAAVRSVATLENETTRKRIRDTGHYKDGWTHSPAMSLGAASAVVKVFNDAPYSGVIELGRRAGRKMPWVRDVPLEAQPIYMWCIRKLGMTADEAAKAARPIAWSIKRKGIEGKYVLRDVKDKIAADGAKEIKKALDQAIRRLPPRGGGP